MIWSFQQCTVSDEAPSTEKKDLAKRTSVGKCCIGNDDIVSVVIVNLYILRVMLPNRIKKSVKSLTRDKEDEDRMRSWAPGTMCARLRE